ncbi:unnamed protein product [Lathyrus sativus]|nr:unnamed protein product [Lathyrus sativus]
MESHNSSNLLNAYSHISNYVFNFIKSISLKCVVDLGIPDIIHNYGKPMPLSKLISSLPIHPSKKPYIYRLMRIMTHSGFFAQQNVTENELETEYMLTDASRLLLKDNPMNVTPFVHMMLSPIMTNPWHQMSTWFRNEDSSVFEMTNGRQFWDYVAHEPIINGLFNESMACDSRLVSDLLIENGKEVLCGLESLVDVGGGTGTIGRALAKSFPQLECIVFDLPHVVDGLQGSENLKYVGGDMFQKIPQANAVLLKWILHDWNDEECVKILKNCKDAIVKNDKEGKVIIIDMVMEEEKETIETQLLFDMVMMVFFSGKERTKKEWAKLFSSAGFSDYKITPVLGLRSVIEIYP